MDSTSVSAVGTLTAFWVIIAPAIASWMQAQFNTGNGWLSRQSNMIKMMLYFALNLILQYVGTLVDFAVGNDPTQDYGSVFWTGLVGAVGGTIIYKLAHRKGAVTHAETGTIT